MLTRRFGRTEIAMPVLSCGGMRYQHQWSDLPLADVPKENQENLEATIRRSIELGINHVETARGYGSSERQLGVILPTIDRDQIVVQTKITPREDPKDFVRDFEESLDRMKLDHVDLLGIHGINDGETLDWTVREGGCFDAAQRLRDEGKVRFIGFSTHATLDVILDAIRHGAPRTGEGFDYVNLHWYFVFQRNWPAIEEANRRDMGVFIISPTDKGGHLHTPSERIKELCAPLHPIVFNDLFCLMHERVHTLSVGAARPTDFDEHVDAVERFDTAKEVVPPIVERLRTAMLEATGSSDPEEIAKGLPAWHDTPGDLNLEVMLWLRNLALGWGLVEYGKQRFNMMGNAGHWFPGAKVSTYPKVDRDALVAALPASADGKRILAELDESVKLLGGKETRRLSQS